MSSRSIKHRIKTDKIIVFITISSHLHHPDDNNNDDNNNDDDNNDDNDNDDNDNDDNNKNDRPGDDGTLRSV